MQPAPQTIYHQPVNYVQVQPGHQTVMTLPSTNAAAALILSIIGIIGSLFYGLGIIFAIPGVVLANGALIITNQFPNHPDAGIAKAAKICGWIAIGIAIMMLVLVLLSLLLYVWASDIAGQP